MSISPQEIKNEFVRSRVGIAGLSILGILILVSITAMVAIPSETFSQWNNPSNWISYPKVAIPVWVNLFLIEKIPEHKILQNPVEKIETSGDISLVSHQFGFSFDYDDFPNDFIYEFSAKYSGSPLLQISVIRPDGKTLNLVSTSLPYSNTETMHTERVFSTDDSIRKNLFLQSDEFDFSLNRLSAEDIVFAESNSHKPLKGNYLFIVNLYGVNSENQISDSTLTIGGKAFGIMGTDELRRDLAIGLLWGTPLALFIGIVVAIASVAMGLVYGVYAGYRGKKTDEVMMRFNDVIYALPALPFLIILSVTISNSIFLMIGFLTIFGWVGVAKVSRSMALQIKTRGYIDAAEMMGQKKSKIILRHILPQLLPYAFASIAISVPAAITTEAGLSFLGLGDPSFPTWGQILHDANVFGAASRGLWWWIMPPGVMIAITGLAFVFIGNALDVIVNPKLRR
ncbi:MAG: ABC transporter permease subunit [Nitrosopumilaceae archaeon]|nr:ABC transporter permease subunit [Nitrosopumilaceae archaeon]NIP09927.1 ABC transporter permease subunit [Nitrosopumilaceae archaeon]NIS94698.1 ABC transporter permease subunit [Nitrosopumilaceae archaeon]